MCGGLLWPPTDSYFTHSSPAEKRTLPPSKSQSPGKGPWLGQLGQRSTPGQSAAAKGRIVPTWLPGAHLGHSEWPMMEGIIESPETLPTVPFIPGNWHMAEGRAYVSVTRCGSRCPLPSYFLQSFLPTLEPRDSFVSTIIPRMGHLELKYATGSLQAGTRVRTSPLWHPWHDSEGIKEGPRKPAVPNLLSQGKVPIQGAPLDKGLTLSLVMDRLVIKPNFIQPYSQDHHPLVVWFLVLPVCHSFSIVLKIALIFFFF